MFKISHHDFHVNILGTAFGRRVIGIEFTVDMIISFILWFLLSLCLFFVRSELIRSSPRNLTWSNKTAHSVDLKWELIADHLFEKNYDNSYTQYIQYRQLLHNSSDRSIENSWIDHRIFNSAVDRYPLPEVQEITTTVDEDSSITSGQFWLQLTQEPYYQRGSFTLSRPIEFNATAEAFEEALQKIDGLKRIRVHRYEPGKFETSVHGHRGTFSWRVEFILINDSAPLFRVYKHTLNGKLSDGHERVKVRRLLEGKPAQLKSHMIATIGGLQPSTFYEFRVFFRYLVGRDVWSNTLELKTEDPPPVIDLPLGLIPSDAQIRSKYVKRISGRGRIAGNDIDADYVNGAGVGGFDCEDGMDGLVVVISYNRNGIILPSRTTFFFTGSTQYFHVDYPLDTNERKSSEIHFIDVKLWGGGGAGGGTPKNMSIADDTGFSHGGGGGFTQTRIEVTPGETLLIHVGSGGKYNPLDSRTDQLLEFHRGGAGGISSMGRYAGSGGGYSAIYKSSGSLIAMAGGGGGGGATESCCSHGGAGSGGSNGEDGLSPGFDMSHKNETMEEESCSEMLASNATDVVTDRDSGKEYISNRSIDKSSIKFVCSPGKGGKNPASKYGILSGSQAASIGSHGFDGRKAGGGGGSGFTWGTGGGGGNAGCGGGGGSGYVDFLAVYVDSIPKSLQSEFDIQTPKLSASYNHIELVWENKYVIDAQSPQVLSYTIELSSVGEGSGCSDDYVVVDQVDIDEHFYARIDKLNPDTTYCIRYVLSLANGNISRKSTPVEIRTLPPPKNTWWLTFPRAMYDTLTSDSVFCEPPQHPSSRRGHTMSFRNGLVYLFGGYAKSCVCRTRSSASCGVQSFYSNEVWVLNPETNIWKQLQTQQFVTDVVPQGREQHSSTVLSNGRIMIIGGRNDRLIFGDIWEMNVGQTTSHEVRGSQDNDSVQLMVDGAVSSFSLNVDINRDDVGRIDDSLCVTDLYVTVQLYHDCVEQLGFLALKGPDSTHSTSRTKHGAKMYMGKSRHNDKCTLFNSTVVFRDREKYLEDMDSYKTFSEGFSGGIFNSIEELRHHFRGDLVNGKWTLVVHDNLLDGISANIHDWSIHFDVDYCKEEVTWVKLSSKSNTCDEGYVNEGNLELNCAEKQKQHFPTKETPTKLFTPRYSHTSIALGNNIYVFGGLAHGTLMQAWRFEYNSRLMKELHVDLKRKIKYGRMSSLSPYGLIMLGGIDENPSDSDTLDGNVYLYDVMNEEISLMNVDEIISLGGNGPKNRYLGGACFIHRRHLFFKTKGDIDSKEVRNSIEPALVMFGGDLGLPYDNFLGDQWLLTIQGIHSAFEKVSSTRRQACVDLLQSSAKQFQFELTCGYLADVYSKNPCRWEDIVRMSWCLEQYNSFMSPI